MLSLHEARSLIELHTPAREAIRLPLAEARGRILREDVVAPDDLPAFDRSAMDGYAVALDDRSERFRVVAEIQPGPPPEGLSIGRGECARVFTGAPIPPGASQVIMQEETRREGEFMVPLRRDAETHIRRRGEDLRQGETVLRTGTRLGPAELSALAFLGEVEPRVSPAPRVLHLATGRELVAPRETPQLGQIRDSNSTLIAAQLAAAGAQMIGQTRCGDDLPDLLEAIGRFDADTWDLLLISGGASVGDYDFGQRALAELGFTVQFTKLNLRPGKPLIFATRDRQVAFVIPGNPVSHFVLFHVAIQAALDCLEGLAPSWALMEVPLAAPIPGSANPRDTFWPARLSLSPRLQAQALRWQSSGDLTGILGANALIFIPAKSPPPAESAQCLPLGCTPA